MSFQVTTAFVEQYKANVLNLVQQRGSRLRSSVMVDSDIVGKRKFMEQVGATEAQQRTSRHADSPLAHTPHARRALTLTDYEWGDLIDDADRVRMLIDPTDAYAQSAAWAMGRAMDDAIIAAATGTAYTGVDGTTSTTLPSAQKVAHGSAALTVAKLISARKILLEGNVEPDEELFIAVRAQQIADLLTDEEVTSADYNTIKALVRGDIDTYMGFKFIQTQRLDNSTLGTDITTCFAWAKSGLALGVGADIKQQIAPRPDKAFSTYVYFSMSIGATRLEEEKVVEIGADESP